jgi:hypothetical protein
VEYNKYPKVDKSSSQEEAVISQQLEIRLGFTSEMNFLWALKNKFQ